MGEFVLKRSVTEKLDLEVIILKRSQHRNKNIANNSCRLWGWLFRIKTVSMKFAMPLYNKKTHSRQQVAFIKPTSGNRSWTEVLGEAITRVCRNRRCAIVTGCGITDQSLSGVELTTKLKKQDTLMPMRDAGKLENPTERFMRGNRRQSKQPEQHRVIRGYAEMRARHSVRLINPGEPHSLRGERWGDPPYNSRVFLMAGVGMGALEQKHGGLSIFIEAGTPPGLTPPSIPPY